MKVVIIGSNRGIGLALCQEYFKAGHEVIGVCRNKSTELEKCTQKIVEQIDVQDHEKLKMLASEIKDIDILLHVSGIWRDEEIDSMNFETIKEQFEVNTLGPLRTVTAFRKSMAKDGRFGLLTSRMGSIHDNTSGGRYGYRMSKAALNAGAKSLAIDLRDEGLSVGILHPGFVRTDMTNGNGLIDADESAQGLVKVMSELTLQNSGTFWHTNGEVIPW